MNNLLDKSFVSVSQELYESKAKRLVKKARKQAERGKGDYELNREQVRFLKRIDKVYGESARKEILNFRNQTLAPLFLIQKKTREFGTVTTKELVGVTKKEWERAVESGKNKIRKRGDLVERIDNDIRAIDFNKRSLQRLETIKRMLSGRQEVNKNLVRSETDKFLKSYNFISSKDTVDLKSVQSYANDIERSWRNISAEVEKKDKFDIKVLNKEISNILDKQYNYRNLPKEDRGYDESLSKSLTSFYLRQNIVNKILSQGDNVFKNFYYNFIDELAKDVRRRITDHTDVLRRRGDKLEFNEIENKVWGLTKRSSPMSGSLSDYYLKIEAEDFEDRGDTVNIEQPDSMKDAKKKIENERYNFIQRFKSKYNLSKEDADKLQALGVFSFIDKERMLNYAKKKLGSKMSLAKIKLMLEKIMYKSVSEKEIVKLIDKLAGSTIDKEEVYEKAFDIFGGDISRVSIKAIADAVIRSSKTNIEIERKLNRAYEAMKEKDLSIDRLKRSILDG